MQFTFGFNIIFSFEAIGLAFHQSSYWYLHTATSSLVFYLELTGSQCSGMNQKKREKILFSLLSV